MKEYTPVRQVFESDGDNTVLADKDKNLFKSLDFTFNTPEELLRIRQIVENTYDMVAEVEPVRPISGGVVYEVRNLINWDDITNAAKENQT
jgi:hypothetical protein